jgi:asparagine synthase (glutamine-hydrolysing)
VDATAIWKSTLSLRHRGPDQQDIFESPHVSLGSVRLKIVDLERGEQPMRSDSGDFVVAFNGELYNHHELRRELEALGHCFHSRCDTEVALRAFIEWDVESFSRFRGMFAAAIWNEQTRRLVLVRDRLGIKPLYYTVRQGNVFFGSELKSLFAHDYLPRLLCKRALGYFLSLNYVPGPLTLVEGIEKLEPGKWLECRNGRITTGAYWRNTCSPKPVRIEDACSELDRLLSQSVREHLAADVPVGIWASGGLDSSTILHYSAAHSHRPIQTFSLSFEGRKCDESSYFRRLAQYYGARHRELDLNQGLDLAGVIHELAYHSDEPSADAGALPVWFLSKLTAGHVKVALSGEGADEIFGGYQTYLADRYARIARLLPRPVLRGFAGAAERLPVSDEKIGFEYRVKRFLAGALLPADEAHFFWNGTFSCREQREFFDHDPEPLGTLFSKLAGGPDTRSDLNRYLFIDQHCYLPDDILHKCDRMSMAHSIELRPPFLDHRIVEFASRLPLALKVRGSQTKYVLRKLMSGKLPVFISSRKKEGLDIPAHEWLRGPLRPLLHDALSADSVAAAGLFSSDVIHHLVEQHLSRRANLGYHLWGLLTLHLWIHRWKIETQTTSELEHGAVIGSAAG